MTKARRTSSATGPAATRPEPDEWPELVDEATNRMAPLRGRPAWLLAVAAIFVLDALSLTIVAGQAAPVATVPVVGFLVGGAALLAAAGLVLMASWGRYLAAALAIFWLAQGLAIGWGWILDRQAPLGSHEPNPLLDALVPFLLNALILFLLARRWPAKA